MAGTRRPGFASVEFTTVYRFAKNANYTNIDGDVMVNVNVYSAWLSSDDNLISCDLVDGPLSDLTATPVTLRCALIEEDVETELKP